MLTKMGVLLRKYRLNSNHSFKNDDSLKYIANGEIKTYTAAVSYVFPVGLSIPSYESHVSDSLNIAASNGSSGNICLFLGTGDTEPTVDDVTLAAAVNTGVLSKNLPSVTEMVSETGIPYLVISRVFTNLSEEPLNIKECCIAASYSSVGWYMLARDVLPTPITLAPGESMTVTYKYYG